MVAQVPELRKGCTWRAQNNQHWALVSYESISVRILGKECNKAQQIFMVWQECNKATRRFMAQQMPKKPQIVEVYSPLRVNQQAEKYGFHFQAARSLDLTAGRGFNKASHRKQVPAVAKGSS